MDAGDVLEVLVHAGVNVVLSGHKHVPYVWRLEDMYPRAPARARRSACAGTRSPATTCWSSIAARSRSSGSSRSGAAADGAGSHRHRHADAAGGRGSCDSPRRPDQNASRSRPAGDGVMRTLALVDGEHHPPVTRAALEAAAERGHESWPRSWSAAPRSSAGGPLISASRSASWTTGPRAPGRSPSSRPELVLDLSDEPILGYRERMELAAVALVAGPVRRGRLPPRPAGGAAAAGPDARRDRDRQAHREDGDRGLGGPAGGPPRPGAGRRRDGPRRAAGAHARARRHGGPDLVRLVAAGQHGASDYLEDAITTGVTTVGARRAGGGSPARRTCPTSGRPRRSRPPPTPVWRSSRGAGPRSRRSLGMQGPGGPRDGAARVPRRLPRSVPTSVAWIRWLLPWRATHPGPKTFPRSDPLSGVTWTTRRSS